MTEAEWLRCEDPQGMAAFIGQTTTRKLSLFNAACCRRAWHLMADPRHRDAVESAEQVADCFLAEQEFEDLLGPVVELWADLPSAGQVPWHPDHFLTGAARHLREPQGWAASYAARAVACAAAPEQDIGNSVGSDPDELVAQVRLLRDIFGNPFRPVAFFPSWRTDTALLLARQMYESGEFSAMPILADALQDAGCDSDDILNHCRSQGVHVRGCWVIDLLLGKE